MSRLAEAGRPNLSRGTEFSGANGVRAAHHKQDRKTYRVDAQSAKSDRNKIDLLLHTRFSLSMENEQYNAGWNGRTCLERPNSQARTGIRINAFSLFS